jgi:excinuclease ABC subunit A
VTGVSGSGKSTLARDVLLANLQAVALQGTRAAAGPGAAGGGRRPWSAARRSAAGEAVDRVLEVDQTPIGKTPRSCPATYIGFWDAIRKLFADTLEAGARLRGLALLLQHRRRPLPGLRRPGHAHHRDELPARREGALRRLHGARFNPETLAVRWRGRTSARCWRWRSTRRSTSFRSMPAIAHPLQLLQDVGLGYLTLGQPSPTLSGGEAQRIKLVTELAKVRDDVTRRGAPPHTLYVLDEPTVGLHMADVEKLIRVLHRLVDGGHSVVVIEHDLDVMAEADWVIDLGPEGGAAAAGGAKARRRPWWRRHAHRAGAGAGAGSSESSRTARRR